MLLTSLCSTVKGIITEQSLVNQIVEGRLSAKCCVDDLINLSFRKVTQDVPLARVARILQSEPLVVVVTGKKQTTLGI